MLRRAKSPRKRMIAELESYARKALSNAKEALKSLPSTDQLSDELRGELSEALLFIDLADYALSQSLYAQASYRALSAIGHLELIKVINEWNKLGSQEVLKKATSLVESTSKSILKLNERISLAESKISNVKYLDWVAFAGFHMLWAINAFNSMKAEFEKKKRIGAAAECLNIANFLSYIEHILNIASAYAYPAKADTKPSLKQLALKHIDSAKQELSHDKGIKSLFFRNVGEKHLAYIEAAKADLDKLPITGLLLQISFIFSSYKAEDVSVDEVKKRVLSIEGELRFTSSKQFVEAVKLNLEVMQRVKKKKLVESLAHDSRVLLEAAIRAEKLIDEISSFLSLRT